MLLKSYTGKVYGHIECEVCVEYQYSFKLDHFPTPKLHFYYNILNVLAFIYLFGLSITNLKYFKHSDTIHAFN